MRGDQLSRQWRIIRQIEASKNGLTAVQIADLGNVSLRNKIRTFALDRVHMLNILDKPFEIPEKFDFQHYIRYGFKVMHDELYTVRIMISPTWARYVSEKIWHESQMIQKHLDGAIEIIFRVAGLSEIKQWVLGLGPEAIVKAPEELKLMVQADLERSLDQYQRGILFQVKEPEEQSNIK